MEVGGGQNAVSFAEGGEGHCGDFAGFSARKEGNNAMQEDITPSLPSADPTLTGNTAYTGYRMISVMSPYRSSIGLAQAPRQKIVYTPSVERCGGGWRGVVESQDGGG